MFHLTKPPYMLRQALPEPAHARVTLPHTQT
jgi:hypothetical protein